MIPKRIFYAWFGKNEIPVETRDRIKQWKILNPEFQIIEINEENFDITRFDFTQKAYDDKKWAFVSDVARLWAVYSYGGFYFDTDVELIKSLDHLTNKKAVLALENSDAINTGLIIGSQKGNRDIGKLLKKYSNITYDSECLSELTTVKIVTDYFEDNGFQIKNKIQIIHDVTIFSTEYFAPFHYWGTGHVTKKTIAIHHYSGSWVGKNEGTKNWHLMSKFGLKREMLLRVPKLFLLMQKTKHAFYKDKL